MPLTEKIALRHLYGTDRRYCCAENDEGLSAEDKALARFQKQKLKEIEGKPSKIVECPLPKTVIAGLHSAIKMLNISSKNHPFKMDWSLNPRSLALHKIKTGKNSFDCTNPTVLLIWLSLFFCSSLYALMIVDTALNLLQHRKHVRTSDVDRDGFHKGCFLTYATLSRPESPKSLLHEDSSCNIGWLTARKHHIKKSVWASSVTSGRKFQLDDASGGEEDELTHLGAPIRDNLAKVSVID